MDGFVNRPEAAARPATVGHGDTSSTGAPALRARSTTTSRACHVGLRSSCSASSCSSSTTTAARSGHGAQAADRAPMTTSTPAAAAAHSCGTWATASPARRKRIASRRARSAAGPTTSVGPSRAAAARIGTTSSVGGSRTTPPPWREQVGGPGMDRFDPRSPPAAAAAASRRSREGWRSPGTAATFQLPSEWKPTSPARAAPPRAQAN